MTISREKEQQLEDIHRRYGLRVSVLYGSRATEKHGADSDADVAVLAERPLSFGTLREIQEALSPVLGVRAGKVDIVDLRFASPLLAFHIARDGKKITGSEREYDAMYRRSVARYLDAKPLIQATEDYVKSYVDRQGTRTTEK